MLTKIERYVLYAMVAFKDRAGDDHVDWSRSPREEQEAVAALIARGCLFGRVYHAQLTGDGRRALAASEAKD